MLLAVYICEHCIEMIAFGMKTTLVRFQDEYYNYKGVVGNGTEEISKDDNGLVIGAFKAAFCADTDATFVYEMCENVIGKLNMRGLTEMTASRSLIAVKLCRKQLSGSMTSNSRSMKW